jgi:Xaa-Pro aminopeptidase
MKYHPISADLFVKNRRRLAAKLKKNSLAIVQAADIMPRSADGTLPYIQNSDFFYLTGVDQEESVLFLFPDAADEKHREILFLRETSEHIAIWEGKKLTLEEAKEATGVQNVQWIKEMPLLLRILAIQAENLYLPLNEHPRAVIDMETREVRFLRQVQQQFPLHAYHRLSPLIYELRASKTSEEIALLQEACNITEAGFRRLLGYVRPGVWEYEIEAELSHEFLRRRSRGFAYQPIIGSGPNACVLHYVTNDAQCQDGQMLLLDVAAEYANYNADLTRTIPVNGRFTERQRDVYNAVLRVFRASCKMLRPGTVLREHEKRVGQIVEEELIKLNLLDPEEVRKQDPEKPLYKKYFMHGTSHHLGLDVHDVSPSNYPVPAGAVLTVEPGIYIREEGLGVRLENDVVITENGIIDLMANIPIEVEHLEDLMNA